MEGMGLTREVGYGPGDEVGDEVTHEAGADMLGSDCGMKLQQIG